MHAHTHTQLYAHMFTHTHTNICTHTQPESSGIQRINHFLEKSYLKKKSLTSLENPSPPWNVNVCVYETISCTVAPGFLLLVYALGRKLKMEDVAHFAFPFIVWPAMPMWCYCFFKKVLD